MAPLFFIDQLSSEVFFFSLTHSLSLTLLSPNRCSVHIFLWIIPALLSAVHSVTNVMNRRASPNKVKETWWTTQWTPQYKDKTQRAQKRDGLWSFYPPRVLVHFVTREVTLRPPCSQVAVAWRSGLLWLLLYKSTVVTAQQCPCFSMYVCVCVCVCVYTATGGRKRRGSFKRPQGRTCLVLVAINCSTTPLSSRFLRK